MGSWFWAHLTLALLTMISVKMSPSRPNLVSTSSSPGGALRPRELLPVSRGGNGAGDFPMRVSTLRGSRSKETEES